MESIVIQSDKNNILTNTKTICSMNFENRKRVTTIMSYNNYTKKNKQSVCLTNRKKNLQKPNIICKTKRAANINSLVTTAFA
jgi:hypothetical protein